ncbi:VQ domain-containing protein, partial [Psidium guajava]
MASSDHMASVDPWIFSRPSFIDPWFTEAYSRDTQTLTKALQKSFSSAAATTTTSNNSNNSSDTLTPDVVSPSSNTTPSPRLLPPPPLPWRPTRRPRRRSGSGSPSPPSGKVSKRKSRASKRSQTTYITADPANFREMVQQVTGARFLGAGLQASAPILKPEPQRPGGGRLVAAVSGCLPTLDTSAFLLDRHAATHHHHQHQQQEMANVGGAAQGQLSFLEAADVVGGGGSGGYDFGSFAGFPTLESWSA